MSLAALRLQLAELVEGTRPALPGLPTGIAALDDALPERGLPRGRLTEIAGAPGSGRTTVLRQVVASTLAAGWWVAYIDASRTLAARDWAAFGADDSFWVVRPDDPRRGAWCADILLRSGAFGLVILDGAPALPRAVAVRLVRLARASDAALVLLTTDGQHAGVAGALQLRVQRVRGARALRRITIEKGGPPRRVEVKCADDAPRHVTRGVREDPQIPDRRGVARRRLGRSAARPA